MKLYVYVNKECVKKKFYYCYVYSLQIHGNKFLCGTTCSMLCKLYFVPVDSKYSKQLLQCSKLLLLSLTFTLV